MNYVLRSAINYNGWNWQTAVKGNSNYLLFLKLFFFVLYFFMTRLLLMLLRFIIIIFIYIFFYLWPFNHLRGTPQEIEKSNYEIKKKTNINSKKNWSGVFLLKCVDAMRWIAKIFKDIYFFGITAKYAFWWNARRLNMTKCLLLLWWWSIWESKDI